MTLADFNPLRMLNRLFGRKPATVRRPIRATYDAARTGAENRNHWANADDLGPQSANTAAVRAVLRKRARYERDNDPHLNGLTKTLAADLIGTGPRLSLLLGQQYYESGRLVEQSFAAWAKAIDYAEKLRLMHEVRPVDGESFGLFVTDTGVRHPVKLNLAVLESEQVATPWDKAAVTGGWADGIEFDAAGNPTYYHVLRDHPGDSGGWTLDYDRVPARNVVHWFRPSRPGQTRGVSEFASVLPIGAQTRRYAAAVLTNAEFAAMISGTMSVPAPLDDSATPPTIDLMDEINLTRGALLTVPEGSDPKSFKAEQPTTTYEGFVTSKRAEMGRPVLAPRNTVTGDSSSFNFASGRLDSLPYQRATWIERDRLRSRVLDRVFLAWVREAESLGLIPDNLPPVNEWVWDWHWDGFASLDPVKEAASTEMRLRLNLTTLAEECAAEGKNWREVIDQRAAEREYMRAKGIDPDGVAASPPQQTPAAKPAPAPDEETADVE